MAERMRVGDLESERQEIQVGQHRQDDECKYQAASRYLFWTRRCERCTNYRMSEDSSHDNRDVTSSRRVRELPNGRVISGRPQERLARAPNSVATSYPIT